MISTPSGRFLGRRPDSPDPKDHRFSAAHPSAFVAPVPPFVDLGGGPAYDQGGMGSCGPNSMDRLMCHLYPEQAVTGFSRLHIYAGVRHLEGDFGQDGGVETRDLFKFVQQSGAITEDHWPYTPGNLFVEPPAVAEPLFKIASYSRLVGEQDMMACLAFGFKFIIGVNLFESFDGRDLARTGLMPMPNAKVENQIGGHDMCVDGYDLNFKSSDVFRKSGLNGDLFSDAALLVCNSWGADWGIHGRFWMPLAYASNPSTGGDSWTGRRDAEVVSLMSPPLRQPTQSQLAAAAGALRTYVDSTEYGGYISDDYCREASATVAVAVVQS